MRDSQETEHWEKSSSDSFWSEISISDHLVQIYENKENLLKTLIGFVSSGLNAGEAVVLIATQTRLNQVMTRLYKLGYDLNTLFETKQFIPLEAEKTLTTFIVDGMPDEQKFNDIMRKNVQHAQGTNGRKVRAYGEMVALLWEQDQHEATMKLEQMWEKYCAEESLCLFCAYPKSVFSEDQHDSIGHICSAHTMEIKFDSGAEGEILYRKVG